MLLEIISPEKKIFQGEAKSVVVPAVDGSLGILDNHAPLISTLKKGIVEVSGADKNTFEINGGVVEVMKNKVIILAE
ncbi:ATP synthase F1 subunit epsilon [Luteibaculum oceani]|uniref:ATP synthase F1 subunit epsilon n=1 Tax=Luteibaculum oceani TaxID=1294296 RepID=A0A5C6V4X3_9FLAO|nr:ATP synthase F1 subunit epsilon [Luteibaculum oceani]TXC78838.1 ATP synthase F1 subunit epsilon [Luteibaculum oceani]